MDTKLTLKLDETIIEKAKSYAKNRQTSLSRLIENYLHKITEETEKGEKITPLVKSLSGIIDLSNNQNHDEEYVNYLLNKYK